MKKLRKILSIFLTISLILFYVVPPVPIMADEAGPSGQDTSSPAVQAPQETQNSSSDNSPQTDQTDNNNQNTSDSQNTQDSVLQTQNTDSLENQTTPTPTPDVLTSDQNNTQAENNTNPSQDPGGGIQASNSADVQNNINSDANTGENSVTLQPQASSISTDSGQIDPEATPSAVSSPSAQTADNSDLSQVSTGDSVSVSNVENSVNSSSVNSNVLYQTVNIFENGQGDIDLSSPFAIVNDIITKDKNENPVINVSVVSSDNYVYLTNEVVSVSNTGENSINGEGDAVINTGNAYSIVSLLNKVNFTVVDSTLHIITINIFGNLRGNIILPDVSSFTACNGCGVSVETSNSADIENNVDSVANSGQNDITASGSAQIDTGQAQSLVGVLNVVNSNYINTGAYGLYIVTYGNWDGSFIGWGDIPAQSGTMLSIYGMGGANNTSFCSACASDVDVNNQAFISNLISSVANTGRNSANGNSAVISTGNAYSSVSVINLINSNFINSFGFFGFVNIFGSLTGDIGGQSNFPKPDESNNQQGSGSSSSGGDQTDGYIEVTQTNNVGNYVLPGDTVTFFIKVQNPSNGNVHDTKLHLSLIKDGVNMGGAYFDIGNISPGKEVRVTTGFVLSNLAEGGTYTARAYAEGITGEDSNHVSASSDSLFDIFGKVAQSVVGRAEAAGPAGGSVLGANNLITNEPQAKDYTALKLMFLSLMLLLLYAAMRKLRQGKFKVYAFAKPIKKKKSRR